MPVPFLDLKAQYQSIRSEMDEAIARVVQESAFAGGKYVEAFERQFAAYIGTQECIGVSNGTAAIELALRAMGIGPGDEVITVANSFFASAEGISNAGATPVLVDCREDDALIDVAAIEPAITKRTKAILPVHLYGQCAAMDPVLALAKKYGLLVIEDACQAHGSTYKGRKAGSMGHAGAFSFYPGKNLGAYGEGGAVTTNDPKIATSIKLLRDHGMPEKYVHAVVGRNERLDGLQGGVLSVKLKHLDQWNEARRKHAALYQKLLSGIEGIRLFKTHTEHVHNYHLFEIRVKNRDAVQTRLKEKGIATGIHYPIPIHLQKAYAGKWKQGQFPVAEKLAPELLSLPMYAELTEEQVKEVSSALLDIVG